MRTRRAFAELRRDRIALAPVTQALFNFVFKPRHQLGQHALYMRIQVVDIEILAPKIAGIHQIEHRGQDLDDALA